MFCANCVKEYCGECTSMEVECNICYEYCCEECMTECMGFAPGHECNKKFCKSCAPTGKRCDVCELDFRVRELFEV